MKLLLKGKVITLMHQHSKKKYFKVTPRWDFLLSNNVITIFMSLQNPYIHDKEKHSIVIVLQGNDVCTTGVGIS